MPVRSYLPSAQFVVIVASIALAGGLVLAAQYITDDTSPRVLTTNTAVPQPDWKTALYEVQGTNPLEIQSAASVQASLSELINDTQTGNITSSVGRSLFLNLTQAKSQGLGGDVPTQERLLAEATASIKPSVARVYTNAELAVVKDSPAALRAYGNALIEVIAAHPQANVQAAYVAVGQAVDTDDASKLAALVTIGKEYAAIAADLAVVPVPQTVSPLHLRIINNFSQIAATCEDMRTIISDPLRGFGGMQAFNSLTGETSRLFTNIAQSFSKNGILFDSDEPGASWNAFLPQ